MSMSNTTNSTALTNAYRNGSLGVGFSGSGALILYFTGVTGDVCWLACIILACATPSRCCAHLHLLRCSAALRLTSMRCIPTPPHCPAHLHPVRHCSDVLHLHLLLCAVLAALHHPGPCTPQSKPHSCSAHLHLRRCA
jgi:hypothetical protein